MSRLCNYIFILNYTFTAPLHNNDKCVMCKPLHIKLNNLKAETEEGKEKHLYCEHAQKAPQKFGSSGLKFGMALGKVSH